jgi:hypothetical protein
MQSLIRCVVATLSSDIAVALPNIKMRKRPSLCDFVQTPFRPPHQNRRLDRDSPVKSPVEPPLNHRLTSGSAAMHWREELSALAKIPAKQGKHRNSGQIPGI